MKYTAVKVLELDAQRSFAETLGNFEAGIVILAGKVAVTVGDQRFEGIGQRQSVLTKFRQTVFMLERTYPLSLPHKLPRRF